MNTIVQLDPDGSFSSFSVDHKKIHALFDGHKFGFCGAIPDLNIFALGFDSLEFDSFEKNENVYSKMFSFFDETYGPIFLVGSDEDGEACDVDVNAVCDLLKL